MAEHRACKTGSRLCSHILLQLQLYGWSHSLPHPELPPLSSPLAARHSFFSCSQGSQQPRCNCTQSGLVKHTDQDKPVYLVNLWWPSLKWFGGRWFETAGKSKGAGGQAACGVTQRQNRSSVSLESELPKWSFKWGATVEPRAVAIQHGEGTGGPRPVRYARCGLKCHHLTEQSTESCTSGTCGSCGGCNYRCMAHWVTLLAAELLELFEPGLTLVWFMVLIMHFLCSEGGSLLSFFVSGWFCFTSVKYYYFVSSLY